MTEKEKLSAMEALLAWLLPGQVLRHFLDTEEYEKASAKSRFAYLQHIYLGMVTPSEEYDGLSLFEKLFFDSYLSGEGKERWPREGAWQDEADSEWTDFEEGGAFAEDEIAIDDEHDLADVLAFYPKDYTRALMERKGWHIPVSLRKKQFVERVAAEMMQPEHLRRALLYLPADEMLRLCYCLGLSGHEDWLLSHATRESEELLYSCSLVSLGYADQDPEQGGAAWIARDVAAAFRTELAREEFWPQYEQYLWAVDTMRLTETLYGDVPLAIFTKVLSRWPEFHLSPEELADVIADMPKESGHYVVENGYLRSADADPLPEGREAGADETGYLPTEQEVWHYLSIGQDAEKRLAREEKKFLGKWGDEVLEDVKLTLYLSFQQAVLGLAADEEILDKAKEGVMHRPAISEDRTDGQKIAADVVRLVKKLLPHVRRRVHRGFTDAEMRRQQKGPQADVVSLADLRKKKQKK